MKKPNFAKVLAFWKVAGVEIQTDDFYHVASYKGTSKIQRIKTGKYDVLVKRTQSPTGIISYKVLDLQGVYFAARNQTKMEYMMDNPG